jgi:antitoxin (DNA-binding transcriptional repressor) of toxin-antitoxin stability system
MEVTISQFRRELFQLVEQAMQGEPLYVTHRNRRFRVVPEGISPAGVEGLTPLQIINPKAPDLDDLSWKNEMIKEWEEDWAEL